MFFDFCGFLSVAYYYISLKHNMIAFELNNLIITDRILARLSEFLCFIVHFIINVFYTDIQYISYTIYMLIQDLLVNYSILFVFLPCGAMRCTVSIIVILSVCLSVRASVTLVDCVHMVRPTIMISSPHGSPIILVSGDIKFIPKFEGGHPERGR